VFRYLCTVRGETWIPSFSISSLAIRSCPQLRFSADILRINSWSFLGKRGLRVGFDFQRVESWAWLGFTLRSWKSANSFRRNRFSANRALRERGNQRDEPAKVQFVRTTGSAGQFGGEGSLFCRTRQNQAGECTASYAVDIFITPIPQESTSNGRQRNRSAQSRLYSS
jgi:hypothetical protein